MRHKRAKQKNFVKFSVRALFLLFSASLLFPVPFYPAITYGSNANTAATGTASSFAFTASTNANRVLIFSAGVFDDRPAYNITAVSYGTQTLTLLTRTASGPGDGTGLDMEIWYLINPKNGTANITVNSALSVRNNMGVIEYRGVSGVGTTNTAKANSNAITGTLTTSQAKSWIA